MAEPVTGREPREREPAVSRLLEGPKLVVPVRPADDADPRDVTDVELVRPEAEDELAPLREEADPVLPADEVGVRDPLWTQGGGLLEPVEDPEEPEDPDEDPDEPEPVVRGMACAVARAGAAMAMAKAATTSE